MLHNIIIAGDVMAGENVFHFGRGIRTLYFDKYENIIKKCVKNKIFNKVELAFYNFEYSLVEKTFPFSNIESSIYRASEESLKIFPSGLEKIVNIANNHFSQHGKESAKYTKKLLKKNNFSVVGENKNPIYIENSNILFWGVSLIKDSKFCNEYFLSSYNKLSSEINLPPKEINQTWIISIHWGDEYISKPNHNQKKLAYSLIDLGFDLIIGHHPHVIQPFEVYKDKLIFYSLGNFIFDQNFSKRTKEGLAVNIFVKKNPVINIAYKTKQSHYMINSAKKIKIIKNDIKCVNSKNIKYIFQGLYRFFMKIEYILDIYNSNKQVLIYLLKKRLNRNI